MATQALTGARIFDGTSLIDGAAVLIDHGRIAAVVPSDGLPAGFSRRACTGLIAPGFIDCQVNGGGGVLFNDQRTRRRHRRHRRRPPPLRHHRLPADVHHRRPHPHGGGVAAAADAMAAGVPGLLGIHLEGPFINPERRGIHDARFVRPIDEADITLITGFNAGRMLVTLAPEVVPPATIARLAAGRRDRVGRPHRRRPRHHRCRARRRPHRLHPPLQRHAAACRARPGTGRRRPRRPRLLGEPDRRPSPCFGRPACASPSPPRAGSA